jgi:transcriptional regulator with PAS, ATPase and Fis domain
LFIDEVGELAAGLQAKFWRVLEDGTMRRAGSMKERRVNVRLIAATNRDLQKAVEAKRFREDLVYRSKLLTIQLPPLRERTGDAQLLVERFAHPDWQLAADVLPTFGRCSWPGNVRQLLNALERAKILADGDVICVENLPPEIVNTVKARPMTMAGDLDLDMLTRERAIEIYWQHDSNKARTARALGVGRRTLYRLLERYQLTEPDAEQRLS